MNNDQFLAEMIALCEYKYHRFERVQKATLEMLRIFSDICYSYDIPFFIVYGTLLGLKRDSGYIPWDYDADVAIPYEYVDKVHKCLQHMLPKEFYYISDRTSNEFPYYQIRICKKGFNDNIHLDIFYMFGLNSNESKRTKIMKEMKLCFKLRKVVIESKQRIHTVKTASSLFAKKIIGLFFKINTLNKYMNRICSLYTYDQASYVSFVFHEDFVFEKTVFGKPVEDCTLGFRSMIPEDSERYLTEYYGEWKSYFPIEKRRHEFEHLYVELDRKINLDLL